MTQRITRGFALLLCQFCLAAPKAQEDDVIARIQDEGSWFLVHLNEAMVAKVDYAYSSEQSFLRLQIYWVDANPDTKKVWRTQVERELGGFAPVSEAMLDYDPTKAYDQYYIWIRDGWELEKADQQRSTQARYRVLRRMGEVVQSSTPPPATHSTKSNDPPPSTSVARNPPSNNQGDEGRNTPYTGSSSDGNTTKPDKFCNQCIRVGDTLFSFEYLEHKEWVESIIYKATPPEEIVSELQGSWRLPNETEIAILIAWLNDKGEHEQGRFLDRCIFLNERPKAGPQYPVVKITKELSMFLTVADPGDHVYFLVVK